MEGFDIDLAALRRHASHVEGRAGELDRSVDQAVAAVDQAAYGVVMAGLGLMVGRLQTGVCGALAAASASLSATAGGLEASAVAYQELDSVVGDVLARGRRLLEAVVL
ncbi:hypothetical protein KIN34_01295 [Cellulomonas sp. DKR-3]|uniref:ESX-1 secretion-associated protein n=1 Tax=Cellulomonas fulva TaxID=2835530 RepID=A0ABS5TUV7_9CELL|nr:type VII secretion target [Cellulomonas fulva]MBT0992926.1 hypothetical protein [Cellulomonas fulva]